MERTIKFKNQILGVCVVLGVGASWVFEGCGTSSSSSGSSDSASGSEVAATIASGSVSAGDTTIASFDPASLKKSWELDLIQNAYADNVWTCGAPSITLTGNPVTTYSTVGGAYLFRPGSCTITYSNGRAGSSSWTGAWTLGYNGSCTNTGSAAHFKIEKQPVGCVLTRTASGGITRTVVGPDEKSNTVTHNTNGAGTGYDGGISASNSGVQYLCTSSSGAPAACTAGTITINGSHLTATTNGSTSWNHTVTTGTPLSMTVSGSTKTVSSGTVVVQHNLMKTTSTTTFSNVVYSKSNCCFPVSGTMTTTYSGGSLDGKTETLVFDGSSCGQGTLTKTDGSTESLTLIHCI